MNEYLGKNIRMLRKSKSLTQEQFAERLGVSFQSVSRWENCVTYPDLEMMPIIARFFGVSTDYLFGIPEENKKAEFKAIMKELQKLGENDTERALQLLRVVRAGYDIADAFPELCEHLYYSSVKKSIALTDELRKMAELYFDGNPTASRKSFALEYFSALEEEPYVATLLDRYALDERSTRNALLYERYLYRDDFDKAEIFRQIRLYKLIDDTIDGDLTWKDERAPNDVNFAFWKNNICLDFLHAFTKETPTDDHPISCGLKPDIFICKRIALGELRTCYLATLGRTEQALLTLEDTVDLMEKVCGLPDGALLESRSPALPTFTMKTRRSKDGKHILLDYAEDITPGTLETWVICPDIDYDRLTSDPRWAWFNPLRKNERFLGLAERVKRLFT